MPEKMYVCLCGRNYIYRASLYNHRKKCETVKLENSKNTTQNAYPDDTGYGVDSEIDYTNYCIGDVAGGDDDCAESEAEIADLSEAETSDEHIHINISMGPGTGAASIGTTGAVTSASASASASSVCVDPSVISGVKMNASYLEHLNALKREREKIQSVSSDISSSSIQALSTSNSSSPPQMMGIITTLMEQNQRLQELIIEQARKSNEREERLLELASRPTTTNINNPRVNILNVLNTEYKEAMDIASS